MQNFKRILNIGFEKKVYKVLGPIWGENDQKSFKKAFSNIHYCHLCFSLIDDLTLSSYISSFS